MYTDGQDYAKVGIVTVDKHGVSYRLRFIYPEGERHQFTIAKISPEGWTTAIRAAQMIDRDINLGDFDDTYARYSPRHARKLQIANQAKTKEYNLKELWEIYKESSKNRVAKTTQKKKWKTFDRYLDSIDQDLLYLNKASEFIGYLSNKYASSTLKALFSGTLHPAVNLAVEQEKIKRNPYLKIKLSKNSTSIVECFEPEEVKKIIQAFKDDRFVFEKNNFPHSYYAFLVEFLALTGCRPSEAHALTWNDIKYKKDKTFVSFNKVYSNGILRKHTKNYTIRLFPCNSQLQELIKKIPRIQNDYNLVFPSVTSGYINQDDWRRNYWTTVVKNLAKRRDIEKYLKPYCLRHSFITRLVREGVDIKTVASLSGNSVRVIFDKYLASRKEFDLPEL